MLKYILEKKEMLFTSIFLTLSQTSPGFYVLASNVKSFENTVGKEKLLVMRNFPFFTVFSSHMENFPSLSSNLKLLSAKPLSLEVSKICLFGNGKFFFQCFNSFPNDKF